MIQTTFTLTNYTPVPVYLKMQNHIGREQATLESTSPLRKIYTPSSIKALFPQNQCKSLFRKFTATTIKTYPFPCNKNRIHDLSNHTLTEEEFSVLAKDLGQVYNMHVEKIAFFATAFTDSQHL